MKGRKSDKPSVTVTLEKTAEALRHARQERIKAEAAHQRAISAEAQAERAYTAARAAVQEAFPSLSTA